MCVFVFLCECMVQCGPAYMLYCEDITQREAEKRECVFLYVSEYERERDPPLREREVFCFNTDGVVKVFSDSF